MDDYHKYKILIVDSETIDLIELNHIFKSEYSVYTAKSGNTALQIAEEEKPDFILLDIQMPDMDGFEVLTQLKENSITRNIPVIFIAGLNSGEIEERGFLLGAVDYIKKPFKPAIIKARVRTHMEMVNQIRAIEQLGLTDPVTDIPNRKSFNERIEMEWRRAKRENKPITLLIIDIDNFRNYNDTYGYPQGDKMLKEAARVIMSNTKRPADFPALLGGEEFGVILPDTGLDPAIEIAENIRKNIEAMRVPDADESILTQVTICIGVYTVTPMMKDMLDDFISNARQNLRTAKSLGKNRTCAGELK
ncbi:MAG: diguanylate cyclase [Treponema sp.]|jgi:diguanylate cyclase (GGDEF)-like protein|nr:diguanylate cyclase [Treponema sp.]